MNTSLDLYRVFCEVAREGSFSGAAAKLFVSQSAVSQSIKQLETALGGKLFSRFARGVRLTEEGRVLYEYASSACNLLQNGEKRFEQLREMKTGELKIGASDTICSLFLINTLKSYNEIYPEIKLSLVNRTSNELIRSLKSGELDIALVNLPLRDTEALCVTPVYEISDCFVVGGRYSQLARRTFQLCELKDYPVLMLDRNSSSRRLMDAFLLSKGVEITPSIELTSIDLLLECAKIGFGISAVIEQAATPLLQSGELYKLQLSEPIPKRHIGLVTPEGTELSFAARRLVELLNNEKG